MREDDLPLRDALEARGVAPIPLVWDDDLDDWAQFDACLVRSVSDYHLKYSKFSEWVKRVGDATTLWNPPGVTLWNADKSYLRDLADAGVPTIPTHWVERGNDACLTDILDSHGWKEAVFKPAVGLGAQQLHRVRRGEDEAQQALDSLLTRHAVLVQDFLPSVSEHGETSLIYIDGTLTHTVRKYPGADDFRVQKTWGGTSTTCKPTRTERDVADMALSQLDETPLYARVDLVIDQAGTPALIELELIEPDLFFRHEPTAAACLAEAIAVRL
jgi:glutathione synthase/RimK-type ligase-like ATP-grasp enzyme